jgi:PAP2 superfamily protein
VPHLQLTLSEALLLAALLGTAAVALHRARSRHRWFPALAGGSREAAVVLLLFALWQLAGALALTRVAGAFDRARAILGVERFLHLPSEAWVQGLVLSHPSFVHWLNAFYLYVHINSIVIFLVWLFVRHRDRYPWARDTLVLLTAACLLVQLAPVAPPRFLPGFVDTATVYGQSVYGPFGSGMADQLSAMPSVHVGWAALVAVVVVAVARSPWRWLVVAHPVLTMLAVVATANHFWLDGVVAALLLATVLPVTIAVDRRRQRRRSAPAPVPEPAAAVV